MEVKTDMMKVVNIMKILRVGKAPKINNIRSEKIKGGGNRTFRQKIQIAWEKKEYQRQW